MGDISLYHVYLESYIQLFQGQRDVYHVETKTEIPIGELGLAEAEKGERGFGHKYYRYLYFDADGDEKPEMVLTDAGVCYVFKYIAKQIKWYCCMPRHILHMNISMEAAECIF